MKLSEHFTLEELIKSDTAKAYNIPNYPTLGQMFALAWGAQNVLEPARNKLGVPIVITSGFRSPVLNSRVGGVSNSQHCDGCAADIRTPNTTYAKCLFDILKALPAVDQLLFEKNKQGVRWLHVSWSLTPRHYYNYNYTV